MRWLDRLVKAAAARQAAREAAACDCDCEDDEDDSVDQLGWRTFESLQLPPAAHNGWGTAPDFSMSDDDCSSPACDDPDWSWSAPTVCDWD